MNYLQAKYGNPPIVFTQQYSQEQRAAWQAINEDNKRIYPLQVWIYRMDIDEGDSLTRKIMYDRNARINTAMAAVEATKQKLDGANQTLKSFQMPYFYLAEFSPAALETSLINEADDFVIHNPKPGTKIFAKVESDEPNKDFFWLVDLPSKVEKLILSDNNLFTAPANSP